jgi:hypothetical protein
MLLTRDINKWFQKKLGRQESMSGWNIERGYFHKPRHPMKYLSRGNVYERKSFGRRPAPTLK